MANYHLYLGLQDLNLTAPQRATLRAAIFDYLTTEQIPTQSPAEILHHAINPDGTLAIIEALFDEDKISVAQFRQHLADTFSVNVADIGVSTNNGNYGVEVTFAYLAQNRFRMSLFGGDPAGLSVEDALARSHAAALEYYYANIIDWQ